MDPNQIAEHHAQLAAFCARSGLLISFRRVPRRIALCAIAGAHRGDRLQQTATMADRCDAELLEVVRGKIGQNIGGDRILTERRRVSFQPQLSQPLRNVHRPLDGS